MSVGLSYIAAFGGGVISFASPCVLPIVPAYLSVVTGVDVREDPGEGARISTRAAVARTTLLFVAGFGLVFVVLGMTASALGRSIFRDHILIGRVTGVVVVVMGLFVLLSALGRFPAFALGEKRFHPRLARLGPFAAPVAGVAFGFGWTPCIGPVLGTILTLSATTASVGQGVVLLALYSAGLAVPFLATSLLADRLLLRLRRMRRAGRYLQIGAGTVTVGLGVAIVTNQLTVFSYWLLDTFPLLARIG